MIPAPSDVIPQIEIVKEWLIIFGLVLAVLLAVLALYSYARKLFNKDKRAGLD